MKLDVSHQTPGNVTGSVQLRAVLEPGYISVVLEFEPPVTTSQ